MPRRKISVLILYNSPQAVRPIRPLPRVKRAFWPKSRPSAGLWTSCTFRTGWSACASSRNCPRVLSASDEPVVFNLVEGFWTNPEQCNLVPTVVRSFGKACTGNDAHGLLLSLDKWQSKTLLAAAGIPTPKGLIVPPGQPIPTRGPVRGTLHRQTRRRRDASEGIDKTSIIPGRGQGPAPGRAAHPRPNGPAGPDRAVHRRPRAEHLRDQPQGRAGGAAAGGDRLQRLRGGPSPHRGLRGQVAGRQLRVPSHAAHHPGPAAEARGRAGPRAGGGVLPGAVAASTTAAWTSAWTRPTVPTSWRSTPIRTSRRTPASPPPSRPPACRTRRS